ncbi:inositol monophosphatase [Litorivicinus sp.]|jgi:myo-inositol-1(or 4)-monophosphatase|nr:inositol monophosphatase [Litorivicinus sp.]|tara:strand:- start:3322 stop:4107 length:786 start_codon:yes stop_codon:yes gene_type:complete
MKTSDVAINAVRAGGLRALEYFEQRDSLIIDLKGPQDYVTQADRNVERLIIELLSAEFPEDGFLGEESEQIPGGRQWVIDPIDGTSNFLRGMPYFCTTLALVENEQVLGGWIYDPTRDAMYSAEKGQGAFCNGSALRPTWRASFATALVGICHSSKLTAQELANRITGALERGAILRQPGAAALMLCDLASGRLDALFDLHLKPWDSIAGLLIASEAGAKVSHYLADPNWRISPQPTLACAPKIYDELCGLWPEATAVKLL